ncbi:MAG: type I 3-dehydroquinate dehydratase [Eubacterium sp.]
MKTLQCRGISLNNKKAKICVPITGRTDEEIVSQAKAIKKLQPDIVEWRADYYQIKNKEKDTFEIVCALGEIHKALKEIPIIFTFRNKEEGGERQVDFAVYSRYCSHVAMEAKKNNVAFIDVEAYGKKDIAEINELIDYIHQWDVKVIGSNHHFEKTPSEEEMVEILSAMEEMGADVCKLAVMPEEKEDVESLISASWKADDKLKAPVITMSMGELGAVTRVCTRLTGSVLTFASGTDVSAPGQLNCNMVRELLKIGEGCEMNSNIALIGFMGTGKTTISKALSRITGFDEIDVDQYIVDKEGMEISDIFEQNGEQYFRELETRALKEIQNGKGQIISCGGGAVLRDENVEILKKGGVIVLLTATPETIFERVKDHTHRPILNNDMSLEHVKQLMSSREPRYQSVADIKVNVDSNDRVQTCYDMLKQLKQRGNLIIK